MIVCGCGSSGEINALDREPAAQQQPLPTVLPLLSATGTQTNSSPFGASLMDTPESSDATVFRPAFGEPTTPIQNEPQPTPSATIVAMPTPTNTPESQTTNYLEVVVYSDEIDPHWSLEQSSKVSYDTFDTSHWFSTLDEQFKLDSGAVTLAVTPLADFGKLFFTVKPDSNITYAREKVLGIRLWVNSGEAILDTDDLALAVVGSNDLSYWSADDYSVFPDSEGSFSETRLYYLGLNRSIPPGSWAQIVLWLDDREFDPIYENVVGFYIKNDVDFNTTFYVDRVSLLMVP